MSAIFIDPKHVYTYFSTVVKQWQNKNIFVIRNSYLIFFWKKSFMQQ